MLYLTGENVNNDIFLFLQKVIMTINDEKIMKLLWVNNKSEQLTNKKDFVICIDHSSFKVFVSYLKLYGCKNDRDRLEYRDCKITVVNEFNECEPLEYPYIEKVNDDTQVFLNNGVHDLTRCAKFFNPTFLVRMVISMKKVYYEFYDK